MLIIMKSRHIELGLMLYL